MAKYRANLPQLSNQTFLTDGGLETTLVFQKNIDLPEFAAFVLLENEAGRQILKEYYEDYLLLAVSYKLGFILETPTWRANLDYAEKLGFSPEQLAEINRQAVDELLKLRQVYETPQSRLIISGNIGPRGDGYVPSEVMTVQEAQDYHAFQVNAFKDTQADLITAVTLNYVEEAVGIVKAAQQANMPVVISYTVETDGKLPTGQTLQDAIEQTDAKTSTGPAYYMINCAHPTHFAEVIERDATWVQRIGGLRANASSRSHEELNASTELDAGNPQELAEQYLMLRNKMSRVNVLGGCCGTDHTHVEAICEAWVSAKSVLMH